MAEKKIKESEKESTAPRFTKESILQFSRYRARRDLLTVLLEEGRRYTMDEVDAEMAAFLKGGN